MHFDGLSIPETTNHEEAQPRGERRFHSLKGLLLESVRRHTFVNWSVNFMNPDKLAKAGFFYLRTKDHVQCVFCRGIVGYWDEGDEPETEHKKHFPNCPFVMGTATGNIPLPTKTDTDEERLYQMINNFYTFKVACTRPCVTLKYQADSRRVSDGSQVAFPHLSTAAARLRTYSRWPKETGVQVDVLAEAGFFFTGMSDFVQCFHCGGGLSLWKADDNPALDHARYYPHCNFIRMKLSFRSNLKITNEPNICNRKTTLSQEEANLLLQHPLAKRLIKLGLSAVSTREALKAYVEREGVLCPTITEALELVFDYDEEQRQKKTESPCYDGLPITQTEQQEMNHEITEPTSTQNVEESKQSLLPPTPPPEHTNPPTVAEYTKLLQEVQELQQTVQTEERRLICRLCGKERVGVVFQPCSHLHLCYQCARPRDSCFTCGSVVRGTLRPIIG